MTASGPVFYVFCGLTGSGKSVLARRFATASALPYLDYDTLVQPMLRAIEEKTGIGDSRAAFYREWRTPCYESLWDTSAEILGCGSPLIASAPCGEETRDPEFFFKLRIKAGRPFCAVGIYLAPDPDLHLKMMKQRNALWNEDIIPRWEEYRREHSPRRPVWDADVNLWLEYSSFGELNRLLRTGLEDNGLETFGI